jgi:hypothetical protein
MYAEGNILSQFTAPRKGLDTGENDLFLRLWHEVPFFTIDTRDGSRSTAKWFPYNKGGDFRRWYGNREYVISWANDGAEIRARSNWTKKSSTLRNQDFYFKQGYTWTTVSISGFSARYTPEGALFDNGGCTLFAESQLHVWGALLNSRIASRYLEFLAPTLNFQPGDVGRIFCKEIRDSSKIAHSALILVEIAKRDWDAFETSWDFQTLPVFQQRAATLSQAQAAADAEVLTHFHRMQQLEEENNRLFIDAYGLQDELSPEVSDEQITLYRPNRAEDIKRLLSYAIGCMMGRYSLDKSDLIYAHGGNDRFWDIYHEKHERHEKDKSGIFSYDSCFSWSTFPADADGIIPLTETDWFPDDASNRLVEFISVAWPKEHLGENLTFIAESLGPNRSEQPQETIRRYFATGFYKHHLQTYKRRPIYWLFSSGKQRAFQCLVYLHRYHEGTLARMRTEYAIPLQGKITARIDQLADDIAAASSTAYRKKLEKERDTLRKQHAELQAFDEQLRHYADQRIRLDLDDGVKVNYGKFGNLLAEVKAVTGGKDES